MLLRYFCGLVLYGLILHSASIYSQPAVSFRHLTVDDGLTQNTINVFFQDKKGYLWMGTQNGLNIYDGYGFRVFSHKDQDSLSHDWVWDIFEDKDNFIWIATWRGLTRYDQRNHSFEWFLPDSLSSSSISGDRPVAVVQDGPGYLWIGTWGGGLNRYDPKNQAFRSYISSGEDENMPGPLIRSMHLDSSGCLWIGTWNGLWRLSGLDGDHYHFQHCNPENGYTGIRGNEKITCIEEDMSGNIWAGTLEDGLLRVDRQTAEVTIFRHDPDDNSSPAGNDISALKCDRNGMMWIGTVSDGLSRFMPGGKRFEHFRHDAEDPSSLGADNVNSIFEDISGNIWVGAGGANILIPGFPGFRHYSYHRHGDHNLSSRKVTCFLEDPDGRIWIGTETGGINILSPETGIIEKMQHSPGDPFSISNNNISSFTADSNGNIWIGTRGGGLNRWVPGTGILPPVREDRNRPETVGLDYINGLTYHDGIVWIATYGEALISYDITTGLTVKFTSSPDNENTISGNYLLRIFRDSRGIIWIGTWGTGLTRFDPVRNQFTRFLHRADDPQSISGNIIHSIYESLSDTGRIIWTGTDNGISWIDPDKYPAVHFSHITPEKGLPGSSVYGILSDGSGRLWISGNSGLARYDLKSGQVRRFSPLDGIQSNEFNAGAFYSLSNGMLLFGGVNGFNMFDPEKITESRFNPKIVITSFRVFDRDIFPGISASYAENLTLNHSQNFFTIEFASLDFSNPAKNIYIYRLEGVDRDWVEAGSRREAFYTGISPGKYVFRVMGTNSDGIWSTSEARLNIHITPPFRQTWWFRIILLSALLTVLYMLHKYRVNRIKDLERLRLRIASDLHDEIGSALTRINIHSQQIENVREIDTISSISRKIAELSRNVISTMSDVVWSIDSRNDTSKDMVERMADLAHDTLSSDNIRVSILQKGMDKKRKVPVIFRQNVFFIFKETINNAVKHSGAGEVEIRLVLKDNSFMMKISDDGTGFDPDKIKQGNGLRNMKMRTARLGGQLSITSCNGTQILLKIHHLKNLR